MVQWKSVTCTPFRLWKYLGYLQQPACEKCRYQGGGQCRYVTAAWFPLPAGEG